MVLLEQEPQETNQWSVCQYYVVVASTSRYYSFDSSLLPHMKHFEFWGEYDYRCSLVCSPQQTLASQVCFVLPEEVLSIVRSKIFQY